MIIIIIIINHFNLNDFTTHQQYLSTLITTLQYQFYLQNYFTLFIFQGLFKPEVVLLLLNLFIKIEVSLIHQSHHSSNDYHNHCLMFNQSINF